MTEAEITPSQAAWNRFADELKRIGDKLVGPTGARSPRERAEGYRYLARLIAAAQELCLEEDRARPSMVRMFTPTRKFVAEGTDTLYHEAKLDPALSYELTVRRGDDLFFSVVVYADDEDGDKFSVDDLNDEALVFDDVDGQSVARIHIGAERPERAKNWLKLDGQRPFILTRQYFPEFVTSVDGGKYRQALMSIERTDGGSAPEAYEERDFSEGVDRMVEFIDQTLDSALGISAFVGLNLVEYARTDTSPTRIGADGALVFDPESHEDYSPEELAEMVDPRVVANNLPGPGIDYVGAMFKLADDEAIVIEGKNVPCRYWSAQILTKFLESGDYRYHRVAINNRQVEADEDGTFRIYASRTNPGVRNWMSTQGYARGQIVLRTLLAEEDMNAELSVVKLADIPDHDRV
ncbi:MAG: DUF1214 domain-containing protein [Myxococcales bacterium]|nr:DUF1214 domain-containing protein [Myxococcales bacterium]